jgi:hypothetical protein
MATIIPISTNTTIAACSQIQVGDIERQSLPLHIVRALCDLLRRRDRALLHYRARMRTRLRQPAAVRVLVLCLAVSLAAVGIACAAASASARSAPPLGGVNVVGLNYEPTLARADRDIAIAKQLHAKVIRTGMPWAVLEPTGPNQINPQALAFTDRLMRDAGAAGMTVIATVGYTPCWASSAPTPLSQSCSTTRLTLANAWPPTDPARYAAFVAYLAHRYGSRLAIEIWNEPDQANELYFAGAEKARRYAALVRAAYPAIKRANPNVRVLAGSLVGSNGIFLRALYAAGMKGYYDGLAVHYYSLTLDAVRSVRQVQLANGDTKPLWLDEFGWSSCWPGHQIEEEQACVTRAIQAVNMTNIIRSLARTSYVAAEAIFQLQDSATEEFGVVSEQEARKPAFTALARALASPFGRVSTVELRLQRRGGHLVASGSGPVGDLMRLEVFKGGLLRYFAVFVLDRFNRYSLDLPGALGNRALTVRVFQYWRGPGGAAHKTI